MRIAVMLLTLGVSCWAVPTVTIYHAPGAPSIDGLLDDSCWQNAAETALFINAGDGCLPEENTRVRLCYDDQRLYVAFTAFEGMLAPALNMLHRVKAEKAGRDASVFSEDCVELFLQPPGKPYFHFAANSGTGTFEGVGKGSDWNGDWECASRRGEASYIVEMAIPFASLESSPEGEWHANFTRCRPQAKELSTWSGLRGGFHQPEAFGILRFSQPGPVWHDLTLDLGNGGAHVRATVRNAGSEIRLESTVTAGDWTQEQSATGSGAKHLTTRFGTKALAEGLVCITCRLTDAGRVIAESAPLEKRLGAGVAEFALSFHHASGEAFLNGSPIHPVPGGTATLRLEPGINVIAVEARAEGRNPAMDASLHSRGLKLPVRWKVAESAPEGWRTGLPTGPEWHGARTVRRLLRPAIGIWGEPTAGKIHAVVVVYVDEPYPPLFPKSSVFAIPRRSRQLMRLYRTCPPEVPLDDYTMVVYVPRGVDFRAFEPFDHATDATVKPGGTVRTDDGQLQRHLVVFKKLSGLGMELSMRWGDSGGNSLAYQPVIQAGGTTDWRPMTATITAPPDAQSAHPLVIKWQNRGYAGTFWVDNIVFREKDSDRNLLTMGTFDEPGWKRKFPAEGPDGSKCLKIVGLPEKSDRQQACWVDQDGIVEVVPGREYIVELDVKCERMGSTSSRPLVGLLFEASRSVRPGDHPLYSGFQALDGALMSLPAESTLRVLPQLRNVRPRHARIAPCYYGSRFTHPLVAEAYADNCFRSGITWTYGKTTNDVVPHLLPKGHNVFLSVSWHAWRVPASARKLLEDHEDWRALNFKGKREAHTVCPTLMLSEMGEGLRDALEVDLLTVINSQPYRGANWDLEQPVIDPPTFCVCPRCLQAFRRFAGLDASVKLTPEIILASYPTPWTDFRCQQNADMAGVLKSIFLKADRPVEFSMYSGYQGKRTREHYGVDWARLAPHLDFAIAGYGGGRGSIEGTLAALGDVPFMGGEMWYLSDRDDRRPTPRPETWRNRILRQYAASGCNGCLIWWLPPMDGAAFLATSEAAAIIAEHEDIFVHELRCDDEVKVDGLPSENWFAFKKDARLVVLLMNFSAKTVDVTVTSRDWTLGREVGPYGTEVLMNADRR